MEQVKENKMGVMPIKKLLVTMSIPIMVSMLVQAMYNIVDSIFISHYDTDALTAISLAFPIQSLMIAVGSGTGIGINAVLSRRLGEKNRTEANKVAVNGLFLAIISFLVFAIFGFFFSRPFYESFGSNPFIVESGTQYIGICTVFSFGLFIQITVERLMQATGNTIYHMFIQGTGAIINIILDPILIFGLFGFPEMGAAGAAIATVIGQISAMSIGLYLNQKKNKEITVTIKGFRPNKEIIWQIYRIGIPSILMQSIVSILTLGLNKILVGLSDTAVSVFGIYFKLQSFIFMPVFGLTSGLIPIVAYNYGAANKKRINDTIKLGFILSISIMLIGTLIFQIIPTALINIFNGDAEMVTIGVPALRIISISFIPAGFSIICSSSFQALGKGTYSLILSVVRQLVIVLPVAYFMAKFFDTNAVWTAFPISEIVSTAVCIILFKRIRRKIISQI